MNPWEPDIDPLPPLTEEQKRACAERASMSRKELFMAAADAVRAGAEPEPGEAKEQFLARMMFYAMAKRFRAEVRIEAATSAGVLR